MKNDSKEAECISPAMFTGFFAIVSALIMALFHVTLAVIPLSIFLCLCAVAPFFPSTSFFLPVISRGHTKRSVVSITFDDGPDPMTTRPLLQLLERHAAKAAFFVTGERALKYGNLISEILERGHDVANHSYSHDPFLMLRRSEKLYQEIASTQILLKRFGISPVAFRPPVGITNPKLAHILTQQGMSCINFSCRAFDMGNRRIYGLSGKILKKVKPDDIILLHDVAPKRGMAADKWLQEIDLILSGLKNKGLQVAPLGELLGRRIMTMINNNRDLAP